jgi:pyrimidine operon attenuation protein/uracil phosphoribosyltransferase
VSLSANNTNTAFVGAKRRGKNILEMLRNKIRDITGVNCEAHIYTMPCRQL